MLPPGLDRDAQEIAKALALSMTSERGRHRPSLRTVGLLWSLLYGLEADAKALGFWPTKYGTDWRVPAIGGDGS